MPIPLHPIVLYSALNSMKIEPLYNGQQMFFNDDCLISLNTAEYPLMQNKIEELNFQNNDCFIYMRYYKNIFKFCSRHTGYVWLGQIKYYNYLVDSNNDVFFFSGVFFFKGSPMLMSAPGKVWTLL